MGALVLALLSISAVQVSANPHKGPPQTGELKSLDSQQVVLTQGGKERKILLRDLRQLSVKGSEPAPPARGVRVQLIDGSNIVAESYAVADGKAEIKLAESTLKTDARNVRAVLFRSHANEPDLAAAWSKLLAGTAQGDLAVVRRSRKNEAGEETVALDHLEGVLKSATPTVVAFASGDTTREVPVAKLEGFVYFRPQKRELKETVARVKTRNGSLWIAAELASSGERLKLKTPSGLATDAPLKELSELRFAASNVVYLSDLKPDQIKFEAGIPSKSDILARVRRPKIDRGPDGKDSPLRLAARGPVFEKGLCVRSRTELVYRLTDKFKRLQAQAGIAPGYRGHVELIVRSENKELFRKGIGSGDPPVNIDLDVTGVRRLTILVDFGENSFIADNLNLCDLRLTK